ncbi:hypothetical protein C5L23_000349 [Leuconostoc fallax]|uniref:HTH cro/C1-type domain-containing protein n=2 Tax=Leuconostoc fallax TaxID=1251 RepID=A0A4R5N801_9LACO|nr:helix-turn-helix transcriptional regulator [Leuconostoc fallax]TDG68043.1 hypothetical protein C5L23_000349 [Leuconostoc fallax]
MTLLSRTKDTAKKRGLSIEKLAKQVGISKSGIYQWDIHEPKPSTIQKVADVLNVSTDYLLGRTDEMTMPLENKNHPSDLAIDDILSFDGAELSPEYVAQLRAFAQTMIDTGQWEIDENGNRKPSKK